MLELSNEVWEGAACAGVDTDVFFPEPGKRLSERVQEAKAICASCSIKEKCLEFAISNEEDGIWGGTTQAERKSLRRTPKYRSLPIVPKNK